MYITKEKILKAIYSLMAIIGVIVCILNVAKICPEDESFIAFVIAYGILIGPVLTIVSIAALAEIHSEEN